jgi:hypothetical protein
MDLAILHHFPGGISLFKRIISDNVAPLPCHLNEFIITEQEILDQLKILNVNKPAGPDGISNRGYSKNFNSSQLLPTFVLNYIFDLVVPTKSIKEGTSSKSVSNLVSFNIKCMRYISDISCQYPLW